MHGEITELTSYRVRAGRTPQNEARGSDITAETDGAKTEGAKESGVRCAEVKEVGEGGGEKGSGEPPHDWSVGRREGGVPGCQAVTNDLLLPLIAQAVRGSSLSLLS